MVIKDGYNSFDALNILVPLLSKIYIDLLDGSNFDIVKEMMDKINQLVLMSLEDENKKM